MNGVRKEPCKTFTYNSLYIKTSHFKIKKICILYMVDKGDSSHETRESSMAIAEITIYTVFRSINEGMNAIECLTAGQLRILEEEYAVRGITVMKDGEKKKNQDENCICFNELGKKTRRGEKAQRMTMSAFCVKKEGCYRGTKCISFGVAYSQPSHPLPITSTPREERQNNP